MYHVLYLRRDKASLHLSTGQVAPNENELHNLYAVVRQFKDKPKPTDVPVFLEKVFAEMQAEKWSPNGEQRELIAGLGLLHTSMSTGDIIYDDDRGWLWLCAGVGFQEFDVRDLGTNEFLDPKKLAKVISVNPGHPKVLKTYIEAPPLNAVEQYYADAAGDWVF